MRLSVRVYPVRETLSFAAALRLPTSVDNATQKLIVDQTIEGMS